MSQISNESFEQIWQAKRSRLEKKLQSLSPDPSSDREWQNSVQTLDRKLRSFVTTFARRTRLSLLRKWRFRPGSWSASKGLIDIFLRDVKVVALFASPELGSHQVYRIPASQYHPADIVTLPPGLFLPPVLPGRPIIEVSSGNASFYVGSEVNPQTHVTYTRGYDYWYKDPQQRKFESGDLIPEGLAHRFAALQPLLAETEEGLVFALKVRNERQQKASLTKQLTSLDIREREWSRVRIPMEQVTELLNNAELFELGDLAAPKGLLLAGVPGTGKTFVARTLANTNGCSFHSATLADLKAAHIGGTAHNVRELWNKARSSEPAIIFLDECEGIFARRGGSETDIFGQDLVQTFLAEWDGMRGPSRVWVIGATNRRDLLDDAILSRFGWEMEIRLPDAQARADIVCQEMTALGYKGEIPSELKDLTQGMSGRDLAQLAKKVRAITTPRTPGREDFLKAVGTLRKRGQARVSETSTWANLVLSSDTKSLLQTTCDLLRNAESWETRGVSVPRGILLAGPPGVGKTHVARTIAHEGGLAFITATTADLKAKWIGHSGSQVKHLFERARASAPAIVFLDELDVIAKRRDSGAQDQHTEEIVGQLLQELDGLKDQQGHVFLLGATNHPEKIDSAVLSRMPQRIDLPLPDDAGRVELLKILLRQKSLGFPLDSACEALSAACAGRNWSGRDLRSWVERAERKAVQRAIQSGGPEHFLMLVDDFAEAEL